MTENNNEEEFIKKNSNTKGFELLCNFSYFHKVAFKVTSEGVEFIAVPINNENPYVDLLVQNDDGEWIDRRVIDSNIEKVERIDFIELPESITKYAGKCAIFVDFNKEEINRISKAMILEGLDPKDHDAFEAFIIDSLIGDLSKQRKSLS